MPLTKTFHQLRRIHNTFKIKNIHSGGLRGELGWGGPPLILSGGLVPLCAFHPPDLLAPLCFTNKGVWSGGLCLGPTLFFLWFRPWWSKLSDFCYRFFQKYLWPRSVKVRLLGEGKNFQLALLATWPPLIKILKPPLHILFLAFVLPSFCIQNNTFKL